MDTIHQELHEFLHSPRRVLVAMGVVLFGSSILAQFLYPADRTLPFTNVDNHYVGIVSRDALLSTLRQRYEKPVVFKAGKAELLSATLADAGIVPNYERTVERAIAYPWWERVIPFSLLTRQWSTGEVSLAFDYDAQRLRDFASKTLLEKCSSDAISAGITTKGNVLKLTAGREGRICDASKIEEALMAPSATMGPVVSVPHEVVYPERKDSEVVPLFNEVKQRFGGGFKVEVNGTVHAVSAKEATSWLVFKEESGTHHLTLAVNTTRVKNYLKSLRAKFYKAPTERVVYLLDGEQQRQEEGREGVTIDIDATVKTVVKAINGTASTAKATTQVVVPATRYVNDYSPTQRGLQALLQDLAREKGNYGLSVIELDGQKRTANANGAQSFTTASTYKIFVAYSVLKEIEAGRITWGQQIRAGMNTEDCWHEMLTYSMNPCSWTFADMAGGWARLEQQAHAQGMTSTFLNASDKRSTANDEALYFAKLELGTLLQGASRQKLIDTLLHQHYRSGIPTGTGVAVADKIGFLDGYLHDVGIVYGPKGRYVLAVMTYGGSWGQIADVAQRVHAFMQR